MYSSLHDDMFRPTFTVPKMSRRMRQERILRRGLNRYYRPGRVNQLKARVIPQRKARRATVVRRISKKDRPSSGSPLEETLKKCVSAALKSGFVNELVGEALKAAPGGVKKFVADLLQQKTNEGRK